MTNRWFKLVNGVEVEMTPEEIVDRQEEEAKPTAIPPLVKRLGVILFTLPDDVQATLITLSGAVEAALENGAVNVARIAIEDAVIPLELEPVRQAMLEEFDRV